MTDPDLWPQVLLRLTRHEHLSSEERARIGIPDGFLRVSIGIEDADDLIADIEQALQQ